MDNFYDLFMNYTRFAAGGAVFVAVLAGFIVLSPGAEGCSLSLQSDGRRDVAGKRAGDQ